MATMPVPMGVPVSVRVMPVAVAVAVRMLRMGRRWRCTRERHGDKLYHVDGPGAACYARPCLRKNCGNA